MDKQNVQERSKNLKELKRHNKPDVAEASFGAGLVSSPPLPSHSMISRRSLLSTFAFSSLAAGCAGTALDGVFGGGGEASSGDVIGKGNVKIGMILPLSSPNNQLVAYSLRNAAEMAMNDLGGGGDLQLIFRDDGGTPAGAQAAAEDLVNNQNVELVLGPLFALSVQAAGHVARAANVPLIAFSSDVHVAQRGVYLLNFLPQADVERVISYASSKGKRAFAALLPDSPYGAVIGDEFSRQTQMGGRRTVAMVRYSPGDSASIATAVSQIKTQAAGIDALLLAEGAEGAQPLLQTLQAAGLPTKNMQLLATSLWNDPQNIPYNLVQNAWFAAPDNERFENLARRYETRFGQRPARIASLAYDVVILAGALTRNFGAQRFSEAALTHANGFSGHDGAFRFRSNGMNDHALAIYEVKGGKKHLLSPPPSNFNGL